MMWPFQRSTPTPTIAAHVLEPIRAQLSVLQRAVEANGERINTLGKNLAALMDRHAEAAAIAIEDIKRSQKPHEPDSVPEPRPRSLT